MPTNLTPELAAEGGRKSGESRRRQTARQIAADAVTIAVERLLTDPPALTPEQLDRLRILLDDPSNTDQS